MRIEITDKDYISWIEKAEQITGTDYERKGNYVSLESLLLIIRDLEDEISYQEEKIEDMEKDIQENYKPLPKYY